MQQPGPRRKPKVGLPGRPDVRIRRAPCMVLSLTTSPHRRAARADTCFSRVPYDNGSCSPSAPDAPAAWESLDCWNEATRE